MAPRPTDGTRKRWHGCVLWALGVWLVLLAASWTVRGLRDEPGVPPQVPTVDVPAVRGDQVVDGRVRIAWSEHGSRDPAAPVVVLVHGSPGDRGNFAGILQRFPESMRVLALDLPGFGDSGRHVPDYSVRAYARYVLEWLDALGIERAHFVGFSLGGGVVLDAWDIAPQRVESVTLLAAIGVQELELFGSYRLNHLVHAGQLAAIWFAIECTPHFGWLDDVFLGLPYARNFYDTDQRSLRGILERIDVPVFIFHGEHDFLVAPEAAREHHRIVPQSELALLDTDHFTVFRQPDLVAGRLIDWVRRVEAGQAPRRSDAAPERVAAAAVPWDPRTAPEFHGMALVLAVGMIALATLVSEDLTCVATGLVAAQGRIGFLAGTFGCFAGIFIGDLLLFAAGRVLGRPAVRHAPLRWVLDEDKVTLASEWLNRRGPMLVILSRFLPGLRLPTYFAAGMLRTRLRSFGLWFLAAAFLWTPALVWISMQVGEQAFGYLEWLERHSLLALVLLGLWILIVLKLVVPLFTFRGRRMLVGRWGRLKNWEFWPLSVFYAPVVLHILWLGIRHRSPLLFTAANPAMPASGFVSEPKYEILQGLAGAGERIAATERIPRALAVADRIERARAFRDGRGGAWPVVLKPDAGQRGSGVLVARSDEQVEAYLSGADYDVLVQEYVPGREFGVFYYRLPGEERGHVFSVTEKRMPVLIGDGRHSLEQLILNDAHAVCMAEHYLSVQAERLSDVPAEGDRVQLVELGTHCRGAIFLDGSRVITPQLERAIDDVSRVYEGFWFGRYDVRVPDAEALQRGEGFKVIELNGVTSEATHIYDPAIGLLDAWRTLCAQWDLAFEIGRRNRDRGVRPVGLRDLVRMIRAYRASSRTHPD